MKFLYNKRGRRGDWEKHSFAFFVVVAVVVLAMVFVIGLQVGRVVEKRAVSAGGTKGPGIGSSEPAKGAQPQAATDIGKNLGAFSDEASKVPVVPPPDAKTTMGDVEKRLTFQDSLPRKEAGPVPLVSASRKEETPAQEKKESVRKYILQAGAFREKGSAESLRKRLAKAGYPVRIVKGEGKKKEKYYKVMVGPFNEREAARKAMDKLKSEMQVDSRLLPG